MAGQSTLVHHIRSRTPGRNRRCPDEICNLGGGRDRSSGDTVYFIQLTGGGGGIRVQKRDPGKLEIPTA